MRTKNNFWDDIYQDHLANNDLLAIDFYMSDEDNILDYWEGIPHDIKQLCCEQIESIELLADFYVYIDQLTGIYIN